jgi:hypothetical protein
MLLVDNLSAHRSHPVSNALEHGHEAIAAPFAVFRSSNVKWMEDNDVLRPDAAEWMIGDPVGANDHCVNDRKRILKMDNGFTVRKMHVHSAPNSRFRPNSFHSRII